MSSAPPRAEAYSGTNCPKKSTCFEKLVGKQIASRESVFDFLLVTIKIMEVSDVIFKEA